MSNDKKLLVIDDELPVYSPSKDGTSRPFVLIGVSLGATEGGVSQGGIVAGTYTIPLSASHWPEMCVEAAKHIGHVIPENFVVIKGQIFYKNMEVEEVRLAGYIRKKGGPVAPAYWQTSQAPTFSQNAAGEPILHPDDVGRTHFSIVVNQRNEDGQRKFYLSITLDLTENQKLFFSIGESENTAALAPLFPIHTSQEIDMFLRAGSDGKSGRNWRNEEQRDVRIYEMPRAPHRVELSRYSETTSEAVTWEALEKLTTAQDSDLPLAALYICGLLAPVEILPENRVSAAWIDLDDVMSKIGWLAAKPNQEQREELRRRLWNFLVYGERAVVVGQRTVPYKDHTTGQDISTRIESAPWKILSTQRPDQDGLFIEHRPAPVRAHLAISKEWEMLLTDPRLAQYLPLGEVLGAIPPNKVAGDWARSIGLCLARLWRCSPRETLAAEINPTREELLTHYTPKTQTVEEILAGKNPKRAVTYYREALQILLEQGLISASGDAAKDMTAEKILDSYGRQGWANKWLHGRGGLLPGEKWKPTIIERALALPPRRQKDLKARAPRRRKTAT